MTKSYQNLTSRNFGYISHELQNTISSCRLLIAGCGIGSQVAEAAVRTGFQNFILVDGDTIDPHNLNRQSFFNNQIGMAKVEALKENILRINPEAKVECVNALLSEANAEALVRSADLIFDTIDFLDLKAIVALHDQAHFQRKPLISSFSVGFGAAVIYFPPAESGHAWIRELFKLPSVGDIGEVSYVERYIALFSKLATVLDPTVLEVMQGVFKSFADGKPCPAPQIAAGAYTVASACITAATQILDKRPIATVPKIVITNPIDSLRGVGFNLI